MFWSGRAPPRARIGGRIRDRCLSVFDVQDFALFGGILSNTSVATRFCPTPLPILDLLNPHSFFPITFQNFKKVLQNTQETLNGIAKWKNEGAELQSAL